MATTLNIETVPIHKLHDELLLEIFAENADLFSHDSALYTTMLTTQVCHKWRTLMLTTPRLWARLIDIDFLCELSMPADWLDEFFRRSGSTPLWIKADGGSVESHILLLEVLADHWDRVENLVAEIDLSEYGPLSSEEWLWLYLPAPHLKTFNVDFGYMSTRIPKSSLAPLFAGNAPNLRHFEAWYYPFDIWASLSWMRNLCSMFFSAPCTLREVMTVLKMLPNLEELEISAIPIVSTLRSLPDLEVDAAIAAMGGVPNSPISLPNLRSLLLGVDLETCVFILERLDTPPGCSLHYISDNTQPHHFLEDIKFGSAVRLLSQFARRYFQSHAPTSLILATGYATSGLTFRITSLSEGDGYSLVLSGGRFTPPPDALSTFCNVFAIPEFSQSTKLKFRLPPSTLLSPLVALFGCFTAVEVFATDEVGVGYLCRIDEESRLRGGGVVFPALKVIELCDRHKEAGPVAALDAFVEARRAAGHLLEVHDYVVF